MSIFKRRKRNSYEVGIDRVPTELKIRDQSLVSRPLGYVNNLTPENVREYLEDLYSFVTANSEADGRLPFDIANADWADQNLEAQLLTEVANLEKQAFHRDDIAGLIAVNYEANRNDVERRYEAAVDELEYWKGELENTKKLQAEYRERKLSRNYKGLRRGYNQDETI